MYKLGITGGIGSGKSTAAEYLSLKNGVHIFNADKESKKRLKNSLSLQHKLINIFGNEIANIFEVESVFSYGNISSKLKSKLNEFGAINFNIIKAK